MSERGHDDEEEPPPSGELGFFLWRLGWGCFGVGGGSEGVDTLTVAERFDIEEAGKGCF